MSIVAIDLERVKTLTLAKTEAAPQPVFWTKPKKRILIFSAAVMASLALMGAAKLFDWKYITTGGDLQKGNYGEAIDPGDGHAKMIPVDSEGAGMMIDSRGTYPDETPTQIPKAGELHLFVAQNEEKENFSWRGYGITADESLDFDAVKALADKAAIPAYWPPAITADYTVLDSFTQFYATQDQVAKAQLLYSDFSEWNEEQLFHLPDGYEKQVRSQVVLFQTPEGKELTFSASLVRDNAAVYGGSGAAVIETLSLKGFESAVYVYDEGEASLNGLRQISETKAIDPRRFGADWRPADSMMDAASFRGKYDDDVYRWQSYSLRSKDLTKVELISLMESIALP